MRIAIVYSGAYNTFDFCYPSQKKTLYKVLDDLNIEYDVYCNVDNYIGYRAEDDCYLETYDLYYNKYDELKKHLPDNYLEILEKTVKDDLGERVLNANKITSDDVNYCENTFRELFGDKLKKYVSFYDENIYKGFNIHNAYEFFSTIIYGRLVEISKHVNKYELDNNFKYDYYISMRPDMFLGCECYKFLYDYFKNVNIKYVFHRSGRPDFIFIGKNLLSNIINYDIWFKEFESDPIKYTYSYVNKSHPNIEKFMLEYFDSMFIYNCYKFEIKYIKNLF